MKTPHVLTLGAVLLLAPLTPTLAQSSWETVDVLSSWQGRAIVADNAGNFTAIALPPQGGALTTAVSLSTDYGATWQTLGYAPGLAGRLTAAPDGTLFATGTRSATSPTNLNAFVLESTDHGATWTTVSNPWAGQTNALMSRSIAAGNSGAIYLAGWIWGGNGWIVRKGLPGLTGFTWSTVDNYPATYGFQPDEVFVRPASAPSQPDELLVCGNVNGAWTIRHSLDSGATWTTIDSYSTSRNVGGSGVAMAPDGSIYFVLPTATTTTVGSRKTGYTTTTTYGWLVRKSANGGGSWANVDSFANAALAMNGSIAVDPFGRVFIAGIGNYGTSLPQTWVVRGSADGGATWVTTDSYLPAGYTFSQAWAVASDALGNVCVLGVMGNGSIDVAPIRRLAAP